MVKEEIDKHLAIAAENAKLGISMKQQLEPFHLPSQMKEEETKDHEIEELKTYARKLHAANAVRSQGFTKPIPEQAKFAEYMIGNIPFKIEKDSEGKLILKGGDVPPEAIIKFFSIFNKQLILSNLTRQETKVLDSMHHIAEISQMMTIKNNEFTAEQNALFDQIEIMAFCTARRAVDGFAAESITKTIHEQVSTLHTDNEIRNEKNTLSRILGGKR